jgi:long-chain fatty acid transport protein
MTLLGFLNATNQCAYGQSGHVLDGVGAADQAMAGATTALPLDAIGAIHRNPASILGLPSSEIGIGMGLFAPSTDLRSSLPGFGSGSTGSDIDISPLPSLGIVQKSDDGIWAFGFGGFAVAGFGVDFPDTVDNPIVSPGFFGGIYSSFQLLQIATPVACQLTDRLSVGIAPTANWASLAVTPFSAAAPDFDPGPVYPNGSRMDAKWGLGFQTGIYFNDRCTGWRAGLNYSSPQWFQDFKINSRTPTGIPRQLAFNLDYPAIISLGLAYSGAPRWDLSCDVRYIDYENTDGFQTAQFAPDGSVTGFGWNSIWALAFGAQYHLSQRVKLRLGYAFNESPVTSENVFFNVAAPAIVQHHLSGGFAVQTRWDWILSFAYHHGFENSVTGPIQLPVPPGSTVGADLSTHTAVLSINRRF